MPDRSDFDNDLTTTQEYSIAFLVITLFALMYYFFMRGNEPVSMANISITPSEMINDPVPASSSSDSVSTPFNESKKEYSRQDIIHARRELEKSSRVKQAPDLNIARVQTQTDDKNLSTKETLSKLADSNRLVESERLKLAAAERELAELRRLKKEQDDLNEAKAIRLAEQLKAEQLKAEQLKAEQLKAEQLKAEQLKAEQLSVPPDREAELNIITTAQEALIEQELEQLNFTLPNGSHIKIGENSVENKIKTAIVNKSKNKSFIFDKVSFASGSVLLDSQSMQQVRGIAGVLNAYKHIEIILRGHTDNTGVDSINMSLSLSRSMYIKNKLVSLGISPLRIKTEGLGPHQPIADNRTKVGRKTNRRIELSILD